jgi:hypothetical protein
MSSPAAFPTRLFAIVEIANEFFRDRSEFYSNTRFTLRVFHTHDGLPPCIERRRFFAITKFAKANRLNNCAVFLTSPL